MASQPQGLAGPKPLRGLLVKEIAISILINIAFNIGFALLLFDRDARIPLWGSSGIAVDLIPATFMPALMMTFGITLGIRRRVEHGTLVPAHYALGAWALPLPRPLPLRALAIALLAVTTITPVTVGLIALGWSGAWSWGMFVAFKLAFSVVHAALVTPVVVVSAMRHCG